jgi:hypothetical protein
MIELERIQFPHEVGASDHPAGRDPVRAADTAAIMSPRDTPV